MRAAQLAIMPTILLAACAGCRRNPYVDTYVDSLTAEYRMLEDEYYDLHYDYEVLLAEVKSLRQNQGQTSSTATDSSRDLPLRRPVRPPDEQKTGEDDDQLRPPDVDPGTLDTTPRIPFQPPNAGDAGPPAAPTNPVNPLDVPGNQAVPEGPAFPGEPAAPGEPTVPGNQSQPDSPAAPGNDAIPAPPSSQPPIGASGRAASDRSTPSGSLETLPPPPSSVPIREASTGRKGEVTHIVISQAQLLDKGSVQTSNREVVAVVVQPRDASKKFVPLPGRLVITALDPEAEALQAASDDQDVLAQWNVSQANAARAMSDSTVRRGIHLKLTMPDGSPHVERMKLVVRYETSDGRELQTTHLIGESNVQPQPESTPPATNARSEATASRWKPRSSDLPPPRVASSSRPKPSQPPASSAAPQNGGRRTNQSRPSSGQEASRSPTGQPTRRSATTGSTSGQPAGRIPPQPPSWSPLR